jgi:hypothetical protein
MGTRQMKSPAPLHAITQKPEPLFCSEYLEKDGETVAVATRWRKRGATGNRTSSTSAPKESPWAPASELSTNRQFSSTVKMSSPSARRVGVRAVDAVQGTGPAVAIRASPMGWRV